jgi:alkanesulfonate monooxygenase SsuD/methylene tetrahydromethanopterin reductase-like flavin-dependent oxidoreductase (luciferase family)
VRYGVIVPNFSTPDRLVSLAVQTEEEGFDGFFLWDHVHREPPRPVSDTWTTLAAIAGRTERIRIGSWVTPLPRRRAHVLARQVVTVDHLSGGRVTLGVGLGSQGAARALGEFARFGEDSSAARRAALLDDGLSVLSGYFGGEEFSFAGTALQVTDATFLPRPVQAKIPIWIACEWPRRAPLRRVDRVDGVCPIMIVDGEFSFMRPEDVAELRHYAESLRSDGAAPLEIAVVPGPPPRASAAEFEAAGATWLCAGTDGDPGWEDGIAELIAEGRGLLD